MKILITGGTGFVGSAMAQALHAQGHVVTVIGSSGKSCRRHQALAGLNCITADTTRPGPWQDAVASQDALINLAGKSVFTLWTKAAKAAILDSRIETTRNLVATPDGHHRDRFKSIARQQDSVGEEGLTGRGGARPQRRHRRHRPDAARQGR